MIWKKYSSVISAKAVNDDIHLAFFEFGLPFVCPRGKEKSCHLWCENKSGDRPRR